MTARRWIISGAIAAGATAVVFGAGSASAAQLAVNADEGYVYVELDHNETSLLANTGIPDWIDQTSTPQNQFVDPAWYSNSPAFQGPNGDWYSGYSFAQLWREAAAHPGGSVSLWLTDPAAYDGTLIQMRQY
ncbi:hypothetical protein AB0N05_24925 [Nocardia sp. NPDC051030]|uniref:hypothetical protein n=1 Tax=Nocardia sp. NPDC051030 TaxID=3155162 RepID=UPI0034242042